MIDKIAFIICCNDETYLNECLYYINQLQVPEGFETDVIVIREATGMTAAYNAGMYASDAKYKVYLHQDVYLLKEHLLYDMLEIFKDDTIGMIGTVGARKLPESAKAAQAWDCGNVLVYNGNMLAHMKHLAIGDASVIDVEAIDGMLMMTQYDIEWDEQTFDEFHFYDISQCMEFRKRGYRVVLPKDEAVWALHDSGISAERGYDEYRRRFCEKYRRDGFVYDSSEDTWYTKIGQDLEERKEWILETAQKRITPGLVSAIGEFEKAGYSDTDIFCLGIYLEIVNREIEANGSSTTQSGITWNNFRECERKVRMLLWRVELIDSAEAAEELVRSLESGILSLELVQTVAEHCVRNQKWLWQELMRHMRVS